MKKVSVLLTNGKEKEFKIFSHIGVMMIKSKMEQDYNFSMSPHSVMEELVKNSNGELSELIKQQQSGGFDIVDSIEKDPKNTLKMTLSLNNLTYKLWSNIWAGFARAGVENTNALFSAITGEKDFNFVENLDEGAARSIIDSFLLQSQPDLTGSELTQTKTAG